jgi:hypothetical protein
VATTKPPHPGTITYIDGDTQRSLAVRPVADVPEESRYVKVGDTWVPVVKVVATMVGEQSRVTELGPNDQPLRTTTQRRGK